MQKEPKNIGTYIFDSIDYFFEHLDDERFMHSFLTICILLLSLSVFMGIRQAKKKGGMLDIQSQKFATWEPFYFIKEHLGIEVPQKMRFRDIFKNGLQEDYFYTQVSKKLNLPEYQQYLTVREKIRNYEKKWSRFLWVSPILLLVTYIFIPLTENLKNIMLIGTMALSFLCIFKLQSKPFKEELLSLQKSILKKMYRHLFKKDFPNDIAFRVKLTKINKRRVPSNYLDLMEIITEINKRLGNKII